MDDKRYLEEQLEHYRQDEQDRQDEERREREQRQAERKEQAEFELRSAETWPEALRKQETLFSREIADAADDAKYGGPISGSDELDRFFVDGKNACERALEIWSEVERANADRIAELERQIEMIQEETRLTVADRLEAENARSGWVMVARAIRDESPGNWLDW